MIFIGFQSNSSGNPGQNTQPYQLPLSSGILAATLRYQNIMQTLQQNVREPQTNTLMPPSVANLLTGMGKDGLYSTTKG